MIQRNAGRSLAATLLLFGTWCPSAAVASEGARYCRDFKPSISYLRIELPTSLQGQKRPSPLGEITGDSPILELARANVGSLVDFSSAAVKYSTIASFIEQLPIAVLGKDDPFLKSLHIRPLEMSIRDAMGFGGKGSRLVEPGEGLPDYGNVEFEVIDDDDTKAYADEMEKIRIHRGLVDRIVLNAVDRAFGGSDGYRLHLRELLALTERPDGLVVEAARTDISRFVTYDAGDGDTTSFPIGQVIENAHQNQVQGNPFRRLREFAQEVIGELIFIGAHEVGHIRNGHRNAAANSCPRFAEQERQADAYAAGVLAGFQFNMTPDGSGNRPINDWQAFFQYYRDSGLTTTDGATGCEYDPPETRAQWVQTAYEVAWDELARITFSSADYTTSEPTAAICTDGMTTWRQGLK